MAPGLRNSRPGIFVFEWKAFSQLSGKGRDGARGAEVSALDPNQGPPFYHCWAGLYGWQPAGRTTLGNASRPRPGHSACSSCSGQDGSRLSPPGASSSHCSPEELARGRLGLPTVKARRATSRGQLGTPPFPAPPGLVCPHAGWAGSPRTGPGPPHSFPRRWEELRPGT